ncbi:MAG: hypothetical protein AB7N65_21590 [Vicinamibacterales bacterium]
MTSERQIAANRANARRSTGPKTEAGKEIAKLNAVRHGGLSPLPVIPEVETRDAWQQHLDGTLESLRPMSHLETVLAERVALLLWRMNRVVRFEREITAVGQERVVHDLTERRRKSFTPTHGPDNPNDVRAYLQDERRRLRALEAFGQLKDTAPMSGADADAILCIVAEPTENIDVESFSMPAVVPDEISWEEFEGWTAGRVRQGIAAMAEEEESTAERLLTAARLRLQIEVIKLKAEADRVSTDLDHLRRERLLPDGGVVDRVTRYEAHLSRQLAQALHELQRLQAARAGEPVMPPVVVDVTVSGSDEG